MQRVLLVLVLVTVLVTSLHCSRKSGEPQQERSTAVFRAADGRTIAMDELRGLSGTFQYEVVGASDVPVEANSLHQQARQAGQAGDYKKAIALLEQAAKLAPRWPYPEYDMAFTYLLMKDTPSARAHYQKTVELAPRGFFTAITAVDTLIREDKGELPAGTYLAFLSLEWMDSDEKRLEVLRLLVERLPAFAPAWDELSGLLRDDDERLAAIEKGLAATPDAETKGQLLINKALLLNGRGDRDGAVRLLGELALDRGSTLATEHLAKVSLASLVAK